jgi:hypothetical protein
MNRVDAPNSISAGSLGGSQILSHNPGHKRERNTENVVRPVGQTTRWERVRATERHALDLLTRVSSESDSAALAPLQQDFCISEDSLVHSLSIIATPKSVKSSLRERSPGVWQVRVSFGCDSATRRQRDVAETVRAAKRRPAFQLPWQHTICQARVPKRRLSW